MDSNISILASRIKEYRNRQRLTQREVAERGGIERNSYEAIENGRQEINTKNLSALAKGFSIPVKELLKIIFDISSTGHPIDIYKRFPKQEGDEPLTNITIPEMPESAVGYEIPDSQWEPFFFKGDYMVTDPNSDLSSGDFVLALVMGEARTAKIQRIDNELWLTAKGFKVKYADVPEVVKIVGHFGKWPKHNKA
jgi:transcriptional regulator with XRE-family HTH domain